MEQQHNLLSNDNELQIDPSMAAHLKETSGWAKFLGILGFIAAGLIAIAAFVLPQLMNRYGSYGSYYRSSMDNMMIMFVVVYLIMAVVVFFVALFTFKFGDKVRLALITGNQAALDNGMKNLKFLFRMQGIISIIFIVLWLIQMLQNGMKSY